MVNRRICADKALLHRKVNIIRLVLEKFCRKIMPRQKVMAKKQNKNIWQRKIKKAGTLNTIKA